MPNIVKPFRCVIPVLLTVTSLLATSPVYSDESLPKALIQTNLGNIEVTLRPDLAPETVNNFKQYVADDFYDGTIFHRVIPGFMVQGGGFDAQLNKQPTRGPIVNEASETAKNLRGTIAMARTRAPDSATSQFFINLTDNGFLDAGVRGAGYSVFGKVSGGMGVVDAIASKPTARQNGMADVPVEPVVIQDIILKQ
ncbi:peptidylprolyl isomerase [Marinobacter sp. CHS3-4]|uniref:peptidylprolyl isomerase n=1 Tax=Marinobacter sp. CHS3-4 TaxID=3045174 RepID=UPI0024B532AA|nr:peptidylprolyl isomerase [Marinobacter sp. CHS3-4]MDI9245268.1 peptidylprolyl isomerase [Marinobacter sp. CHS3-4]